MGDKIDAKTEGAWLIHHADKLQTVVNAYPFDNVSIAGKAGILLSALSISEQQSISHEKVRILSPPRFRMKKKSKSPQ